MSSPAATATTPVTGRGRGFASMSASARSDIARQGGKAAHAKGRAHKWTSEEARAAGRKGGGRPKRRKTSGENT